MCSNPNYMTRLYFLQLNWIGIFLHLFLFGRVCGRGGACWGQLQFSSHIGVTKPTPLRRPETPTKKITSVGHVCSCVSEYIMPGIVTD